MKTDTKRCRICGRRIALDPVATDLKGDPVLVWHYTLTKKECPGSLKAAYLKGEFKPR